METSKVRKSERNNDDVKIIYDALYHIQELFLSDNAYKEFGTEITQFSDSLIISIKENQNGGIYYMISDCSFAIHSLLASGFLCRGTILKGHMIHQNNICFGPAYLEAIKVEGSEALPIVKIKKELVEFARQYPGHAQIGFEDVEIQYILNHLKELNEHEYYVNFFENYDSLVGAGSDATKERYEKTRNFIETGLTNSTSYSAYKKYNWTRDKFNASKITRGYNIPTIEFKLPITKKIKMFPKTITESIMSWGKRKYLKE
ncbi:MAG: hypothetical protein ACXVOH_03545 [Bacteroidia bacterium]